MALAVWPVGAAIAAGTAYSIPANAGLPVGSMLTDVISVLIMPLAGSTVAPVQEVRVAPNTTNPAAGQVSLQTTGANAQKLISGDTIPANSVVVAIVRTQAEGVIQ